MAFLHVSTAYVCGTRDGVIGENDPTPPSGFANEYGASKAAAEALVTASGLSWAIARPSVVVGHSTSGAIRDPRFDDRRFRAATGLTCPPTDLAYLKLLIDYCLAVGFLKGGADHASRS